jgi:acyl-coenzyme A thioesterase PaaI-like protein
MAEASPVVLPWDQVEGHQCFGCCPGNPAGLGLRFVQESQWELSTSFSSGPQHESYPSVVHGGIAATVLDELMGNALAICRQRLCFTTGLRTRFIEPLRTGRRYRAVARIDAASEGKPVYRVEADIADIEGNLLVTASGNYQVITRESARAEMGEQWSSWAERHGYFSAAS